MKTPSRSPLDDDDPFHWPFCGQDDDGCDVAVGRWGRELGKAADALGRLAPRFTSQGPDIDGKFTPPDGKGKILGVDGHAYLDTGTWSALDGRVGGEYTVGVDGEGELAVSPDGVDVGGSVLAGARLTGPEIEVPVGPVVVRANPELWGGLGGKAGGTIERKPDGTVGVQVKSGVSPAVGGSLGLSTELNDEFFRWLFPPDGN